MSSETKNSSTVTASSKNELSSDSAKTPPYDVSANSFKNPNSDEKNDSTKTPSKNGQLNSNDNSKNNETKDLAKSPSKNGHLNSNENSNNNELIDPAKIPSKNIHLNSNEKSNNNVLIDPAKSLQKDLTLDLSQKTQATAPKNYDKDSKSDVSTISKASTNLNISSTSTSEQKDTIDHLNSKELETKILNTISKILYYCKELNHLAKIFKNKKINTNIDFHELEDTFCNISISDLKPLKSSTRNSSLHLTESSQHSLDYRPTDNEIINSIKMNPVLPKKKFDKKKIIPTSIEKLIIEHYKLSVNLNEEPVPFYYSKCSFLKKKIISDSDIVAACYSIEKKDKKSSNIFSLFTKNFIFSMIYHFSNDFKTFYELIKFLKIFDKNTTITFFSSSQKVRDFINYWSVYGKDSVQFVENKEEKMLTSKIVKEMTSLNYKLKASSGNSNFCLAVMLKLCHYEKPGKLLVNKYTDFKTFWSE